jgi:hypothetical protein
LGPGPARAFEFFDGRLGVHGFYEAQVRGISRDFDDDFDLTQWYNVLNLEIEADVAPDGFGPFDLITLFSRIEVRYDCVWTRGCGLFSTADAYGDRAKRQPRRLIDGRRSGYAATMFLGDTRRYPDIPLEFTSDASRDRPNGSRIRIDVFQPEAYFRQFNVSPGLDGILGTADDPAPNTMRAVDGCTYGAAKRSGWEDGLGRMDLLLGIDHCKIQPIGALADVPNPFRAEDFNPIIGSGGAGALPFRPAPLVSNTSVAPKDQARGVYYPNANLARLNRDGDFDELQMNFSEAELAWNHGASQDQTKELKEAYFDLEMFESRLWMRIGLQNIVWGKTELFRTTDQFNPQDLALASLPSLEESRIALWALRGVWSFYDVGPLEDVRLELAINYDEVTPSDFGRCGEPYTVLLVCQGAFGLQTHGVLGLGLAGVERPPDAWDSWKGIEVGGRLEWRWDRFSFALTDFYGYSDLPYAEQVFAFSRNVDPRTGRPRMAGAKGPCRTGREASCLTADNALELHPSNQHLYAWICAMTIGVTDLDRRACGNTIFNSVALTDPENPNSITNTRVVVALSNLLAGDVSRSAFPGLVESLTGQVPTLNPLIPLSKDLNDGTPLTLAESGFTELGTFILLQGGLQAVLTDEQEALLGCGPFYGTFCDGSNPDVVGNPGGVDFLNAEASALFQSWPGIEGTLDAWDTTDARLIQPGTVAFRGGPVCTRYENGKTFVLPGCRGPGDVGYDINVDGSPNGLDARGASVVDLAPGVNVPRGVHPFTGQPWQNEMSILSWNMMMFLVGFSGPADPNNINFTEFDASDEFRKDGCSFAAPQFCFAVTGFLRFTRVQRSTVRAGGNGRYGRRDFAWALGAPLVLKFEKRNVLGFSLDWAEDLSKSNWSVEATWIEGVPAFDNDRPDGLKDVDTYNLTVSVDRPTFINFLNSNRTFFFNSQWFFQYVDGYNKGFPSSGPWNAFFTLTVATGYLRDRLLPSITWVYDFRSNSGANLPQITYRFTNNFSATFGMAFFWGRTELRTTALTQIGPRNRIGRHRDKDPVDQALSVVRERDELFLRVKYTF